MIAFLIAFLMGLALGFTVRKYKEQCPDCKRPMPPEIGFCGNCGWKPRNTGIKGLMILEQRYLVDEDSMFVRFSHNGWLGSAKVPMRELDEAKTDEQLALVLRVKKNRILRNHVSVH